MKKFFLLFTISLFCNLYSQAHYFQKFGLSSLYENQASIFSTKENPSYFAYTEGKLLFGVQTTRLFVKENSEYALAAAWSKKKSNFYASYQYSGFSLYHKQEFAGGYTHTISNFFKIGARVIYEFSQIPSEQYKVSQMKVQLGIAYSFSSSLKGGSNCYYPIVSPKSPFYQDKEIYLQQSFAYLFQKGFSAEIDITKDLRLPLTWKIGLKYKICSYLEVRTSVKFGASMNSFGISYLNPRFNILLDMSYQAILGASSNISFIWKHNTRKKIYTQRYEN